LLAGTASIVLTINIAITTVTNFALKTLEITVTPLHSALRNATRAATLETQAVKFGGYRWPAPGHH
jgi:hypothetical protein